MQYRKYYGVFSYYDNTLFGISYDDIRFRELLYFNNYVYVHDSLGCAKHMLESTKRYKYFSHELKSNLFILKLSGRYLTPILKKYNKLYRLDWSQYIYANKVYAKDRTKMHIFYVRSMCFNRV